MKIKILAITLAIVLCFMGTAYASTTGTSPFISKKYTHADSFDSMNIYNGIDVSEHQYVINWEKVRNAGVDFAIIRCGYRGGSTGKLNVDNYFSRNIKAASESDIPIGIYFFSQAINEKEAREEANYVLDLIDGYDVKLPIIIDFEYQKGFRMNKIIGTSAAKKKQATKNIIAFSDVVKAAGYESMVYASTNCYINNMYPKQIADAGCKFWIAQYNNKCTYIMTDYSSWQYTSSGKVAGISGRVDCNFWYGDDDYFDSEEIVKPVKTTGLKATDRTKSSITLSWNNNRRAAGYYVYKADSKNGKYTQIADVTNESYTDSGLKSSQYGYYKVAAYNVAGVGIKSDCLETKTLASVKPGKVSGIKRTARTVTSITLGWNEDIDADGYYVYRSDSYYGTYKKIATVNKNSYKNTGLANGRSYYYKVQPFNYLGDGKISDSVMLTSRPKADIYGTVNVDEVTIRKNAGTSYAGLGKALNGEVLTVYASVLDKNGNLWYRIKHNGITGYIEASSVDIVKKITTLSSMNLRKGPSTSYGKYCTVPANLKRIVHQTKIINGETWYKIKYKYKGSLKTGWICGYYKTGSYVTAKNL